MKHSRIKIIFKGNIMYTEGLDHSLTARIWHCMIKSENVQLVTLWSSRICNVGCKTIKSRRAKSCLGTDMIFVKFFTQAHFQKF